MICLFGVCIPLNLVVPFLLGLLHRVGFVEPALAWARRAIAKVRQRRGGGGAPVVVAAASANAAAGPSLASSGPTSARTRLISSKQPTM